MGRTRIKIDFLDKFGVCIQSHTWFRGRSTPVRDDGGSPSLGPHASAAPAPAPVPVVAPATASPADDERTRGSPDQQRRFEGTHELERRFGAPGAHDSATLAPAPGITPAMLSPADDERTRGSPDRARTIEALREFERGFGSPVDERRRVTGVAAKAVVDLGPDLKHVHDFPSPKDQKVECDANKYCLKLSHVQEKDGSKAVVHSGPDLKHVYDLSSPKDEKVECDANKYCLKLSHVQEKNGSKTVVDSGPDLKHDLPSPKDEKVECEENKYSLKLSPVQEKNDSKLPLNKRKRQGLGGKRNPISVDKMHSTQPSSTALSDRNECLKSESSTFHRSSKRSKKQLQNSSSTYSQKVQDVIILDDEDTQPKEEVNFEMSDRQKEPKIYCPSRDNQEVEGVTRADIKCLDPGKCLSSPVINFYIEYIKRTTLSGENFSDKFYIFNTYFYGKLEEVLCRRGDFTKLRRWWKGVNILSRPYIILPIHQLEHWSLIIICMPLEDNISEPLILHLDSLAGLHPSAKIMNTIGRYLEKEWCYVSTAETTWTSILGNIRKKIVQVPQQKNAYDCGIFMLYYIHQFIKDAPQRTTFDKLDLFNHSWFKPNEASSLRNTIRELLLETFESARLNDSAMSEADASEGNDNIISDSHEESKQFRETAKINKGIEAAASKEANLESKRDISEDAALQKTSASSNKCNEKTIHISRSLSEADVAILWKAPTGSKGNVGMIRFTPIPDVVRDSCDAEATVQIIRAYKKYGPCRWKEGMEPGIRYWECRQTDNKRLEGAKLQHSRIQMSKYFRSDRNG